MDYEVLGHFLRHPAVIATAAGFAAGLAEGFYHSAKVRPSRISSAAGVFALPALPEVVATRPPYLSLPASASAHLGYWAGLLAGNWYGRGELSEKEKQEIAGYAEEGKEAMINSEDADIALKKLESKYSARLHELSKKRPKSTGHIRVQLARAAVYGQFASGVRQFLSGAEAHEFAYMISYPQRSVATEGCIAIIHSGEIHEGTITTDLKGALMEHGTHAHAEISVTPTAVITKRIRFESDPRKIASMYCPHIEEGRFVILAGGNSDLEVGEKLTHALRHYANTLTDRIAAERATGWGVDKLLEELFGAEDNGK